MRPEQADRQRQGEEPEGLREGLHHGAIDEGLAVGLLQERVDGDAEQEGQAEEAKREEEELGERERLRWLRCEAIQRAMSASGCIMRSTAS